MTDLSIVPEAPAVVTTEPAPPPVPPPQPITEKDLWTEICRRASEMAGQEIAFGTFPLGQRYLFREEASKPIVRYERGKPLPIKETLGVFAIFGSSDDFVRIYAIPMGPSEAPTRVTLSRIAPVPSVFEEVMSLDAFSTEIGNEVAVLVTGGEAFEEEEEEESEDPEPEN